MERSNADRMLSEAELETVSGSTAIDASLQRFAAANAGSDDANSALAGYAALLKRQPIRRK